MAHHTTLLWIISVLLLQNSVLAEDGEIRSSKNYQHCLFFLKSTHWLGKWNRRSLSIGLKDLIPTIFDAVIAWNKWIAMLHVNWEEKLSEVILRKFCGNINPPLLSHLYNLHDMQIKYLLTGLIIRTILWTYLIEITR